MKFVFILQIVEIKLVKLKIFFDIEIFLIGLK